MDSLANYGSDDDYDDSSDEQKSDWRPKSTSNKKVVSGSVDKVDDANYEEVQMDLSEESNDGSTDTPIKPHNSSTTTDKDRERRRSRERGDDRKQRSSRNDDDYSSSSSSSNRRREDRDRDDYYRRDRDRERYRRRDDDYKRRNDDDKTDRDRYRDERRRSRRSSSRERQRSRSRSKSPRRSDYSRGSRERNSKSGYNSSKKYERTSSKMAHLEKLGIEIKTPDCQFVTPSDLQKSIDDQRRDRSNSTENNSRFFVPGITGRFRDQIEKRKLLWQKKQEPEEKKVEKIEPVSTSSSSTSSSRTTKVWEAVNFAQDQDGKVASKFKRLMGIKGQSDANPSGTDVLKKQEEMFSSMEAQYEVARTATHTMRGVGLGFGSFQR